MGLALEYLQFIERTIKVAEIPDGSAMCELGNQHLRDRWRIGNKARAGKGYFRKRYRHVSLDLNGLDGAERVDLSEPITRPDLVGQFDIVTNSGTSEHIADQFVCFRNIHELAKVGGVMIHLSPETGSWTRHSRVFYTWAFFRALIGACGYDVLTEQDLAIGGPKSHLICLGLRKTEGSFVTRQVFEAFARETVKPA